MRKDELKMSQYYPYPYSGQLNSVAYPTGYWNPANPIISNYAMQNVPQQPQYMINVDGENSAKAWQPSVVPQPNTIIPLFDSDGQHVYFKTYDAYGRMNPLRKGRIIFDDEIQVSEMAQNGYVTKEDLDKFKEELLSQINQNGSNSRGSVKKNE